MGSGLRQGWSKILCKGTSHSLSPSFYTVIQMSPLLCVLHPLESSYKCIHFVLTISPLAEVSFPLFSSSIFLGHEVWNHNCPDLKLLSLHILTLVLRGWLNWVSAQTEWIIHSLWADFFFFLYSILGPRQHSTLSCQGVFIRLTMNPIFAVRMWQHKMLNNKASH